MGDLRVLQSEGDNSTVSTVQPQESSQYMQLPGIIKWGVGGCEWESNFGTLLGSWSKCKRLRICLIRSVAACVLLLFCLGVLLLVEFVLVHPQPPKCDIVSLTVTQFTASTDDHFTAIGTHTNMSGAAVRGGGPIQMLTATIVVTLRARNQILSTGIFYDHVHVMVLYNSDEIGEGWVGPFFQARRDVNLLQTQVEAHKLPVRHETWKQLLRDLVDRIVDLQVHVRVLTRVRLLKYITHHFRVHVSCAVTVDVSTCSPSTLLSKACKYRE